MKKIAIVFLIVVFGGSLALVRAYDKAPVDDQTQEEKNLEILSKKLVSMKKQMDKFVKDMSVTYQTQSDPAIAPYGNDVKVDMVENDKDFVVTADLPGMDKDKIDISLEGGRILKISGMRSIEKKETSPGVIKQERTEGRFERQIELPAECKNEGIGASYKNGVLEISIPKKEPIKKETIKVKVQ